jgi:CRP-like cAMP-binding protein
VVDAVAQTEATVHVIPLTAFKIMMSEMPDLLASVLHDVAKAHRMQSELAVSRLVKDADARCAEWLLRQVGDHTHDGASIILAQRKRLIAAQLGIAPETFSRVLRHLRDRHLISGTGRSLRLLDSAGLRQLAGS